MKYKTRPPAGSVSDLIMRFRDSQRYRSWTSTTRARRDAVLADFMRVNGRMPIRDLRRADVIQMRDSLGDTPAAANNFLKALRTLLDYGLDLEMVDQNVARLVKDLPPRHKHGFREWAEHEIEAFLEHWEHGSVAHLALTLMLFTGAARIDVVRLGPGNVRGDRIEYRRAKTNRTSDILVSLPILPPLGKAIAPRMRFMTFLQTACGTVRSEKALTGAMSRWVASAGLGDPDEFGRYLNCHGLRKAMGRRLAEAGCSPHEIMAILGHAGLTHVMTYSKKYDRSRAAETAMERMVNISPAKNIVKQLKKP